jgi:two-component system sensor histidine kinase CpxA
LHRIFTRVFLSFWAAIVLIAAASVAVTTLNFKAKDNDPSVVTKQAADVLDHGGLPALRNWLSERNKRVRGQRTLIFDSNGREITGQRPPKPGPNFKPWLDHGGPPDFDPRGGPGFGPMPGMRDFPPPPGRSRVLRASDGTMYRVVFDPPPRRGPFSPPFSWPARGVLLALAIAISGLVSYLLARSIASPLQDLQGAARSLSTGNLAARSNANVARRKDEIGTLAREFDSMAERLSDLISARQQLLRDISHELRSPLARLQMALQLLRQDASSADSQLDRIERESERLEMLIDQVLEYARLERDPATLKVEEVDLTELVRQIVHDAMFESQSAPERLQFTHADSVLLQADPNLLHAVIDNVVRNAMIHGGETSKIELSVSETPNDVTLTVRDHGSGVPESELQRIFEPFYRVVDSISQKARNEGSGIGLAIAARAMALHGGRITAQNAFDGGLLVTMWFPRATRAQTSAS